MAHIQQLSSDEFEGRAPGTEGGAKTVTYLIDQFRSLGLEPGNPDVTYVQPVPLVGITPRVGESLQVQPQNSEVVFLEPGADYVAFTKRVVDRVDMDGEIVFVGYGVVAPAVSYTHLRAHET